MRKIFFIFQFSLLSFFCSAQNYEWEPIIPGIECADSSYLNCYIKGFVVDTFHDVLWMYGRFKGAAGIVSPNMIGYDGTNFIAFPGAMSSANITAVNQGIMYNGDMYFAAGASGVIKFDFITHQWTTIGLPSNNGFSCLAVYNGNLIAGGCFYAIDTVVCQNIARWDGQWYPLGFGITGNPPNAVLTIEIYHQKLFAGGVFEFADGGDAWNIAVWNDTVWSTLCNSGVSFGTDLLNGNHLGAEVYDMEVYNDKLYVGGRFEKVCNINCYLAYWDDTTWYGTNYPYFDITKILIWNNEFYIKHVGGSWVNSYDGNQTTTPVDSNFNSDSGLKIVNFQNIIYAGGGFDSSGLTPTFRLAKYTDKGNGINEIENASAIKIYPNPAGEDITIESKLLSINTITITDALGRELLQAKTTKQKTQLDIHSLASGVYFINVVNKDGSKEVKKFVKE